MKYDNIIEQLGEFGPYQKRIYFLLCLPAMPHAIQTLGIVFTMGNQDQRCAIPDLPNDTYNVHEDWHRDVINKWIPVDNASSYSHCRIYSPDDGNETYPCNRTVTCSRYVFDTSVFDTTIKSDMDLVCEDTSLTTFANMIYMAGMLTGSLVFGTLSDLIGRKKTLIFSILGQSISSLVMSFVKSYTAFVILRYVTGFFGIGMFIIPFVMGLELVGPKTRRITGMILEIFWTFGLFINVFQSYFLREWRYLQIVTASPTFLLLSLIFLIPESPRWLIQKGRYEEAMDIINKAAKVNGVTLSDNVLDLKKLEHDDAKEVKLWQIFTSGTLVVRTAILIFAWAVVSMVFYGLSLNMGNLAGDIFVNITLAILVEMVGYVLAILLVDRVGRKPLLSSSLLVSGIACLGTMVPVLYSDNDDMMWLIQTLALIGKLGISISFSVVFLYTAEVFPTTIRNSCVGLCSLSARIGGMVCPYIADLDKVVPGKFGIALPLIIFGGSGVISGLLILLLPETTNRILPECIEDAKHFGKKRNEGDYKTNEMDARGNYRFARGNYRFVSNSSEMQPVNDTPPSKNGHSVVLLSSEQDDKSPETNGIIT